MPSDLNLSLAGERRYHVYQHKPMTREISLILKWALDISFMNPNNNPLQNSPKGILPQARCSLIYILHFSSFRVLFEDTWFKSKQNIIEIASDW